MSKILEGLDKAVGQKIQNIIQQNPKGSASEKILLGKFLGSDQGSYARNVLGKDHTGWIEHITSWLKKNQPRLQQEFDDIDFSDLESLAYDIYENYLAKQGQLEGYSAGASGGAGLGEEQAPMFTPEDKMVNANDPNSDGWRIYKASPSGILEGILKEYDTKTIDSVVERLPKGLTVNNFTHPAFKEFLYQKYADKMKAGWDKLWPFFSKEYNEKHGIKEYKQDPYQIVSGDSDFFDDMLVVIPKGLGVSELYKQAFKEFLYKKFADREWTDFKSNRFAYWDAYQKLGGSKPQGIFNKLKSKIGLEEDVYVNSLYKEFLDSEYNNSQGSYIDTLRNLGEFIRSKGMPEDKAKPIIRRLVAKLHPSGINEDQMALAELKCWAGYTRVRGVPAGAPGSCKKKTKESSIMKGVQSEDQVDEYKEIEGQRKIEFSKENPPDLYYLYQQFIQRMLNPENTIDPYEWIDKVNKHYGLNYTWKDYQKRGHNDHTNNWQKVVNKYIVNKK